MNAMHAALKVNRMIEMDKDIEDLFLSHNSSL